jgi:hypothetical protein
MQHRPDPEVQELPMPEASVLRGVQAHRLLFQLRAEALPTPRTEPLERSGGERLRNEPMVFEDLPKSVQVIFIAGSIFLGPYLIIRAWLEERTARRRVKNMHERDRGRRA